MVVFFQTRILKCLSHQFGFRALFHVSVRAGVGDYSDNVQYITADWICQTCFFQNIVLYFFCCKELKIFSYAAHVSVFLSLMFPKCQVLRFSINITIFSGFIFSKCQ